MLTKVIRLIARSEEGLRFAAMWDVLPMRLDQEETCWDAENIPCGGTGMLRLS